MRLTTALRASVVVAALATGSFGGADPATLAFGIAKAEATEFYTRKRVRGRWITGHFTRRHGAAMRRSVKLHARLSPDDVPQDDPGPATASLNPNPAAEQRTRTEPARPVEVLQPGTPTALSEAAPLSRDERLLKPQAALHAHARNLASDAERASDVPPAPSGFNFPRPVRSAPEPKAVSFDLQSGVKTTVFTDGTRLEERFDPASMTGLAGAHPVRTPGVSRR